MMMQVRCLEQRRMFGWGLALLVLLTTFGVFQNCATVDHQQKASAHGTSLARSSSGLSTTSTPLSNALARNGSGLSITSASLTTAGLSSYELARTESLGFFTDITNDNWRMYQTRARTEVIYSDPHPAKNTKSAIWLLKNVDPIFTCPQVRRVGGRGDGPKWTCDPHRLLQRPDCLVYSIGSNDVYSFEDGLVNELGTHCEIHVFDPSPNYGRANDPVQKNIHYHAWGLMAEGEAHPGKKVRKFRGLTFLSLPEIMQRLNHTGRTIDVFKIDCEGCEKTSYLDWVSDSIDIRQILIETHFGLSFTITAFFDRFLDHGFVPFSKEANSHPSARPHGVLFEWGFVRLHTDFLQRNKRIN